MDDKPTPSLGNPVHATGAAAGLAGALTVIMNVPIAHYTGHPVGLEVVAAQTTIITYILGAYLHVRPS